MSDAELKQLNTALNRNREHRETIKRLTKELEAYKAEDTPAFEEVCMRNQALTADLAAMTAERDRFREVVESAHTVAHAAPELNPSNYTHDQACELNTSMCEVFNILDSSKNKKQEETC